ncbi:hypothetical protein [Nocardiopsis potens]|uniref:hypothetical protein n=1 Tax=Nocardiopsis potens TaxID=1246458 RepID=UPI0003485EA0|nr:hypothetical protein [Nocardiopsis potens]
MDTTPHPRHDGDGGQEHTEVEVVLLGGPPDWHGRTLSMPASAAVRESAGAHLISDHTPHRTMEEDTDPRAVYDPDPAPAPQRVWWFRGWLPASTTRMEWVRPSPADREPVEATLDGHGAPAAWTAPDGTRWAVDRLQVHWVYEGEGAAGGDVGVWQVRAHSSAEQAAVWELVCDPAVGWAAARVPASG